MLDEMALHNATERICVGLREYTVEGFCELRKKGA